MKNSHFKGTFRLLLSILVIFVFSSAIYGQKTSVSGVVKDAGNGEPIIGANVFEKGTTNGTITDLNGQFNISVPSNAILVFKYVGYTTVEMPVAGNKNMVIQLKEDAISLGEVVAIGYGVVRKNDATGSVTAIKPDNLNKGLTINAQDMITGKIAGVNVTSDGGIPGGKATIRIRGGSSLNASNDPLIVIDGLAMDNDGIKGVANALSTINPNDIETFTVLKDASATAIYGSRASNGVIIITTKKGEKNSKPRISYNGNVSVSTIKSTIPVLTADQFRNLVDSLYPGTDPVADKGNIDIRNQMGNANTDWQKQIFQTAISTDHNISVTGGLKNMPYRFSVGYTNQNGIIKTSNFERYTGSFSLNPSFFDDHLKVNLNGKGMLVKNRYAEGGAIGAALSMDPTQPVTSTDPVYVNNFGGYWQWYTTSSGVTIANPLATKNPLATLMQKKDVANSRDFIGSAEFDYKVHFLPELRLHLNLGMESSYGIQNLYIDSLSGSDTHHGRTGYEEINKINESLNYYMQYAKEIGNNKFDIMAGYEWQKFHHEGSNEYQGLETNITDAQSGHVGGYNYQSKIWKSENLLVSFFGRINYAYENKYLATLTLREDGSSRFAADNRWALFPALAFAWKINEEDFLKDVDVLSDLKLRLGYGVTGQQNINQGDYPYIPVYQLNIQGAYYPVGNNNEYISTYRPNVYNSKLKWEQTTTWNGGLDFGFLNARITGSLDYYYRVTNDLLNTVSIPAGSNFSNQVISNIGSLSNKGVEFSINGKAISTKDLTWEIGYNFTYNKNEITKLISGSSANYIVPTGGISSGTGNNIQAHAVGYAASSFYVYQQKYDSITGKPIEGSFVNRHIDYETNADGTFKLDANGNKIPNAVQVINDDDRYFYHNPTADITMGLSSKIIYKNFDFGFTLRASLGNYMYNDIAANRAYIGSAGVYSSSGFFLNKPTSALVTNFTQNATNFYLSDYFVQNASFVRCDNITLGYSFKNLFKAISSGRIYATVQNPFVITSYKGLDPEFYGGIDNNIYPRPMVTMVGVSLNF
ncbi:MAG: SusC/RagA family TonB-linked outer membrane protein [Paludibacter sp.]